MARHIEGEGRLRGGHACAYCYFEQVRHTGCIGEKNVTVTDRPPIDWRDRFNNGDKRKLTAEDASGS
jgi:hypothetical protein